MYINQTHVRDRQKLSFCTFCELKDFIFERLFICIIYNCYLFFGTPLAVNDHSYYTLKERQNIDSEKLTDHFYYFCSIANVRFRAMKNRKCSRGLNYRFDLTIIIIQFTSRLLLSI